MTLISKLLQELALHCNAEYAAMLPVFTQRKGPSKVSVGGNSELYWHQLSLWQEPWVKSRGDHQWYIKHFSEGCVAVFPLIWGHFNQGYGVLGFSRAIPNFVDVKKEWENAWTVLCHNPWQENQDIKTHPIDNVELKLSALDCYLQLHKSAIRASDIKTLCQDGYSILRNSLDIYAGLVMIPDQREMYRCGPPSASTGLWDKLIADTKEELPLDVQEGVAEWRKVDLSETFPSTALELSLVEAVFPVFLHHRCILVLAVIKTGCEEWGKGEREILMRYAELLAFYVENFGFHQNNQIDDSRLETDTTRQDRCSPTMMDQWRWNDFYVRCDVYDSCWILSLHGNFNDAYCSKLVNIEQELLQKHGANWALDLSRCAMLTSRSMGLWIEWLLSAQKRQGKMVLLCPSRPALLLLQSLGLDLSLVIFDDVASVLKFFQGKMT